MEQASRYYRQPKMKQKNYFELLQQQRHTTQHSDTYKFTSSQKVKQPKTKQRDLFVRSASQHDLRNNNGHKTTSPKTYASKKKNTRYVRSRPNSVELGIRPISILKKASSTGDVRNMSFEEDFIFDEDYLDYVSPRDVSRTVENNIDSGDENSHSQTLNYSFEDEISNPTMNVRPLTPRSVKRVNFQSKPTYFNRQRSPRENNIEQLHINNNVNHRDTSTRPRNNAKQSNGNYTQQNNSSHHSQNSKSFSPDNNYSIQSNANQRQQNTNCNNNNDNVKCKTGNTSQKYPYQIRQPLYTESNVVDFGTYISKKLSKLKFKKTQKVPISGTETNFIKSKYVHGIGELMQSSTKTNDNFVMIPGKRKETKGYMNQEFLY